MHIILNGIAFIYGSFCPTFGWQLSRWRLSEGRRLLSVPRLCMHARTFGSVMHDDVLLFRKGWRSSDYTAFDFHMFKLHNQANPSLLMCIYDCEISLFQFPPTARLLCNVTLRGVGGSSIACMEARLAKCD